MLYSKIYKQRARELDPKVDPLRPYKGHGTQHYSHWLASKRILKVKIEHIIKMKSKYVSLSRGKKNNVNIISVHMTSHYCVVYSAFVSSSYWLTVP